MTEVVPHKRRRTRQTRKSVFLAERLARVMISIGGIGTIFAVSLILLFLFWVVVPLFGGASTGDERRLTNRAAQPGVANFGCDDYRIMAWTLARDGRLTVFRVDTGAVLVERALVDGPAPTAIMVDRERHGLALGFADGSVRLGSFGASASFEPEERMPESVRQLAPGEIGVLGETLVQRTSEGQFRVESFSANLDEPMKTDGGEVVLLDHAETARGNEVCVLDRAGRLRLYRMTQTENLLTGEVTRQLTASDLPFTPDAARGAPMSLLIASGGSSVYLAWRDGGLIRYDTRDIDDAKPAESLDLVPEPGAELTALSFLIGRTTLIAGDSRGRLHAWFCTKPADAGTIDGAKLVHAHELAGEGSAVTALSISMRTRTVAAGFADGRAGLYNVTSSKQLAALETEANEPITAIALSPKEDGLLAVGAGGLWSWSVDLGHPEANFQALFRPVWYEGYESPEHVWQSSSGTDDFEPKYGLMPLVFGTLKATFYSMLFGVPLALLAAIFSSEFLSPRVRVPVKSLIEIMAGLPSVVLGFLAAIIIAPFVQHVVPQTLAAFATIPFALLLGSRLWQLLPQKLTLRWEGTPRLACIALMVPLGILLASLIGPVVERVLFGGDVFTWLSGGGSSALGGWVFLFLPLSAFAVAIGSGRWVMPWMRKISHGWSRARCAWADLARFLVTAVVVVALAWLASATFAGVGLDARGAYVGTYVQRNAMIVGFVMGFAIIPIIYTIAEDALTSVPEHLRLASLGAGATPWQTAVRVIIPTAMSGLFSAMMVGLGRAVGETMIVLMATGNTPVMNWNIFSGFRTLSANIATELPEAVRNSTHYRTLFLAAFVLFAITFAVNTGAEIVRQRFRKRAYQL